MSYFSKLLELIRYKEWLSSKFMFHLAVVLMVSAPDFHPQKALLALISIASMAIFGYTVNEYADIELDTISGKINKAIGIPVFAVFIILIISVLLALFLSSFWLKHIWGIVFIGLGFLMATFYSLKPIRLKTKGATGVLVGSLAQWMVPVAALCSISEHSNMAFLCLILLSLFIGLRWMCIHQLVDMDNDEKGSANTFAVKKGNRAVKDLIVISFILEIFCLFGILVFYKDLKPVLMLGILAWLLQQLLFTPQRLRMHKLLFSYERAALSGYYFFILPVSLCIYRSLHNKLWLLLLPLCIMFGWCYVQMMMGDFLDSFEMFRQSLQGD